MDLDRIRRLRRRLKFAFYLVFVLFLVAYLMLCRGTMEAPREEVSPLEVSESHELLSAAGWADGGADQMLFTPAAIELRGDTFHSQNIYLRNRNRKDFFVQSIERLPYRLQLEGYMALSDRTFCFFIRDGRSGLLHRGTVGDRFPDANFRIESFEIETGERNGLPFNCVHVNIFDQEEERTVDLTSKERRLTDSVRVNLTVLNGETLRTYALDEIGEEVVVGDRRFQLLKADPSMAVIQRTDLAGENPRVEIFYPDAPER